MLLHSSAIFHVYLQEFCGCDLFFCIQTRTCPLAFQYGTFPTEEQKAGLINKVFRDLVCKPFECKMS